MAYTVVRTARSEIVKDVHGLLGGAVRRRRARWWPRPRPSPSISAPCPRPWRRCCQSSATTSPTATSVIMNDPYHGGMHLPDIFMFMPMFPPAGCSAFAVVICHHTDVGGRVPGSNASDSHRDLPGGAAHPAAQALRARPAERDARKHDRDQCAACRTACWATCGPVSPPAAGRRARPRSKLLDRYGADEVHDYMQRAARLCRAADARGDQDLAARAASDSPTTSTTTASPTRRSPSRSPSPCTTTAAAVDFAGSSPQVKGALNSTLSFTQVAHLSQRALRAGR